MRHLVNIYEIKAENFVILKDFIKGILNICRAFHGLLTLKFPKKYHSKNV